MKRRDFMAVLGGIAIARPSSLRAQQALPRIGRLAIAPSQKIEDAFRQGLRDFGYVEGQSLLVDYRRAGKAFGQLEALAAELVTLKLDVIVTSSSQATRAILNQTRTIPIVMMSTNPVGLGFVASLAKPGGNVTGVSLLGPEVSGKRLQFLKQAVPGIARVAMLWKFQTIRLRISLSMNRRPLPRHWVSTCRFSKGAMPTASMLRWRLRLTSEPRPSSCCRRRCSISLPRRSPITRCAGACLRSTPTRKPPRPAF